MHISLSDIIQHVLSIQSLALMCDTPGIDIVPDVMPKILPLPIETIWDKRVERKMTGYQEYYISLP
jgi:hypothetical protein